MCPEGFVPEPERSDPLRSSLTTLPTIRLDLRTWRQIERAVLDDTRIPRRVALVIMEHIAESC